jgi:hypothetical protein
MTVVAMPRRHANLTSDSQRREIERRLVLLEDRLKTFYVPDVTEHLAYDLVEKRLRFLTEQLEVQLRKTD